MKIKIIALVMIFMLISSVACGSSEPAGDNSGEAAVSDGGAEVLREEADEYIFADLDLGGENFVFLNPSQDWDFYNDIILEAETGEILDDSIYARNRTVEENFNLTLVEVKVDIGETENRIRNTVLAGDDAYDATYCPAYNNGAIGALITQGLFYNLKDFDEFKLDQAWWNQNIQAETSLGSGSNIYFVLPDINIMSLQTPWCVYINEDMMTDLGLDLPYSLVKSGAWTYDKLYEYARAGAQLNGAADFNWDQSGPAVYGLTAWQHGIGALFYASGERFVSKDAGGMPYLSVGSERFISAADKIAEMTGTAGVYQSANDWPNPFNFQYIFRDGKALTMIGELKAADSLRQIDTTFGIVPLPKYDANQDRYYSSVTMQMPVLTVPVTNLNPESTGIILDAMAYLSYKNVTPVFFDVTMSQKQLRNEESIEMLQIIKDTVVYDVGTAYGWTASLFLTIRGDIDGGRNNAMTAIERQRDRIEISIADMMELIN